MICCVQGNSYTLFIIMCWLLIVTISCGVGMNLGMPSVQELLEFSTTLPLGFSTLQGWAVACLILLPFCLQKLLLHLVWKLWGRLPWKIYWYLGENYIVVLGLCPLFAPNLSFSVWGVMFLMIEQFCWWLSDLVEWVMDSSTTQSCSWVSHHGWDLST